MPYRRKQRNNAVDREVDIPKGHFRLVKYLAKFERNQLEVRKQVLILGVRQSSQQVVSYRYSIRDMQGDLRVCRGSSWSSTINT